MKAVRLTRAARPGEAGVTEVPNPTPGPGEALVRLKAAALNRRDLWLFEQEWEQPFILGSDGAGVVEALGEGAIGVGPALGTEVVINPSLDWGDREDAYGKDFNILGYPRDGTCAQAIALPAQYVYPKPPHLTWEEAAALPLAGLTAYRAVAVRAQVQAGDKVLVHGIGGGVAVFALQIAKLLGAEVMVTSTRDEKLEKARALGADLAVNSRTADWRKAARDWSGGGGVDVVVDSVGGDLFAQSVHALRLGGRLATYGATAASFSNLDVETVYWNQLVIVGSTMGSPKDFAAMLAFVQAHKLRPVLDSVWPLAQTPEALHRMAQRLQFGKIGLTCG